MRATLRLTLSWLLLSLCIALALSPGVAGAGQGSVRLNGHPGGMFAGPLIPPQAEPLIGAEGRENERASELESPEAIVARDESQSRWAGLSSARAAALMAQTFPALTGESAAAVHLPRGAKFMGYANNFAAQLRLASGRHAVMVSSAPLAVGTGAHRSGINLTPTARGAGFEPLHPAVEVDMPNSLSQGVSIGQDGVTLTPITAAGAPASSQPAKVDGATVFYGGLDVGADVDELAKPTPTGVEEDAVLRSASSPHELRYRIGVPAGAKLVSGRGSTVDVVDGTGTVGQVSVPGALDAEGVEVPLRVHRDGDTLAVTLLGAGAKYGYPILVDPVYHDYQLVNETNQPTNWRNKSSGTGFSGGEKAGVWDLFATTTHADPGWSLLQYPTQGEEYVQSLYATVNTKTESARVRNYLRIDSFGGTEEAAEELPASNGGYVGYSICVGGEPSCAGTPTRENMAVIWMEADHVGEGVSGEIAVNSATVTVAQANGPTVTANTSSPTISGEPNVLYGKGSWIGPHKGIFELKSSDPGMGVYEMEAFSPPNEPEAGWKEYVGPRFTKSCNGIQCPKEFNDTFKYASTMFEGEQSLLVWAYNSSASRGTIFPDPTLKIDAEPPHALKLEGVPSTHELLDGQHATLKAYATDGKEGTHSSGLASIELTLNGKEVGSAASGCPEGPCSSKGEWVLNGENYPAGEYVVGVIATDNAGNVATLEEHITIRHATPVNIGPGTVSPVTGELALNANDVTINAPNGSLIVSRSYRSRHVGQGIVGPLGSQWLLDLAPQESLQREPGGLILTGGTGEEVVFTGSGTGPYTSPPGDAGTSLTASSSAYILTSSNGATTTFEQPAGSTGVWLPTKVEGPGGTNAIFYKFRYSHGVFEPTEELAPIPANVTCGNGPSELTEGCRALKFEYDEGATTAGEKPSEWGEFAGRLQRIRYISWNEKKEKQEPVIAEYAYDKQGHLRTEWNPQISPAVKTTLGYSPENRVSSLEIAGHEPALFEEGTTPADNSGGRLLATAVPAASTALATEAPVNTETPQLSTTTPAVGSKISVNLSTEKTPGKWSGAPQAFIYQWEDCNSTGKECTAIGGANNESYYPVSADQGHTLVAVITALNAINAVNATTVTTSAVAAGTQNTPLPEPPVVGTAAVTTLEYAVPVSGTGAPYNMSAAETAKWGQTDTPNEAMAVFPATKVQGWPAKEITSEVETVNYLDARDRQVNTAAPGGAISTVEYNNYNDVTRRLTADNRATALAAGSKSAEEATELDTQSHYNGETKKEKENEEKEVTEKHKAAIEPGVELLNTLGPLHPVRLPIGIGGKHNEEALAREKTIYSYNENAPSTGGPYHLVTKLTEEAETEGEQFATKTTEENYSGQSNLGWTLRKPTEVITDPAGLHLVHTTTYTSSGDVVKAATPGYTGKGIDATPVYASQFGSAGAAEGQLNKPTGIAVGENGEVWVADRENNRIEEYNSEGKFLKTVGWGVSNGEAKLEVCTSKCQAGISGSGQGQFSKPGGIAVSSKPAYVYVSDGGNNRIQMLTTEGAWHSTFATSGAGAGQVNTPTGLSFNNLGGVLVAVDYGNNRIDEWSSGTTPTFMRSFGWGVQNGKSELQECNGGTGCQAGIAGSGNGQFFDAQSVVMGEEGTNTRIWVVDRGNSRIERFTLLGAYLGQWGKKGTAPGEFGTPWGISQNPATQAITISDSERNNVQLFTPAGTYIASVGATGTGTGQFTEPKGVAFNSSNTAMYVVDGGNSRLEEWVPSVKGAAGAHVSETIYYTAKAQSAPYAACGEKAALAGLPCLTKPQEQPNVAGMPEVVETSMKYNIWFEPTSFNETFGSASKKRERNNTYDPAGRPLEITRKAAVTSGPTPVAQPAINYGYNAESGELEEEISGKGTGEEQTIKFHHNRLGEIESYTDGAGVTTYYEYDILGRRKKDYNEKTTETLSYNTTKGTLEKLVNTYTEAGKETNLTFGATVGPEGNLMTETWPNGMTVTYTQNSAGKVVGVEYKKTTHCTSKCVWFRNATVPSIHGQVLEQISEWSEEGSTELRQANEFDGAGHLIETQTTPSGKGCTTRLYGLEEDGNRVSLTTRAPGTGGACATEGGSGQGYVYTSGDQLDEPGIAYNALGDTIALPQQTTEQPELTSTFFAGGQAASLTQNKQTISYKLDPDGRTLEADATGEPTKANILSHYSSGSSLPGWTVNTATKEWTRNITGISGVLVATQTNNATPLMQLDNLHEDIVATASESETATGLTSKSEMSEFGVPTSTPSKYSWLGAMGLPTELPSGAINMGDRTYIPQLGRFLQPDPVSGGSEDAYAYVFGDPVDQTDPTGNYVIEGNEIIGIANARDEQTTSEEEARERAAREAAERAAREAEQLAAQMAGPSGEEWWEEWEEWEGEGGYEYISAHHSGKPTEAGAHEAAMRSGHGEAAGAPGEEAVAVFGPSIIDASGSEDARSGCALGPSASTNSCVRDALSFHGAFEWIKHHARGLIGAGVSFVTGAALGVATVFATISCVSATEGLESLECAKIAMAGGAATQGAFIAGVAALYSDNVFGKR